MMESAGKSDEGEQKKGSSRERLPLLSQKGTLLFLLSSSCFLLAFFSVFSSSLVETMGGEPASSGLPPRLKLPPKAGGTQATAAQQQVGRKGAGSI